MELIIENTVKITTREYFYESEEEMTTHISIMEADGWVSKFKSSNWAKFELKIEF